MSDEEFLAFVECAGCHRGCGGVPPALAVGRDSHNAPVGAFSRSVCGRPEHRFVKVRYTYRLRMTPANERKLVAEWDACRWVWNQCVALDSKSRRASVARPQVGDLDRLLTGWRAEHEWLRGCCQNMQQQTIRDFCKARADAWAIRKRGGRRGDPRFRSKRLSLPTLNVTRSGPFRLRNGKLLLPHGIVLRPVWSRDLPSDPSSVRVSRDPLGRWQASFVVERPVEPLPSTGRTVGVDWGVKAVATTTDPVFDLPHTPHRDRAQRALGRYQRQMARRRPKPGHAASRGYQEAKRHTAREHARIVARRQDEARKWAVRVVREFDRIAVEDFNPMFMFGGALAARAASARTAAARRALEDAAAKHGRELVVVPAAGTTQTCSSCGARAKHRLTLSERTFECDACGFVADRDVNAARNVAARAGFDPAGDDRVRQGIPLAA